MRAPAETGSFKVRGALAKLLSLGEDQRDRGVVAASSGNHGLGVAYALSAVGGTGIVCVPEHASPVKVATIRRYGVEVRMLGKEPAETERMARRLAAVVEMSYLSPYTTSTSGRHCGGQAMVIVSCGANISSAALAEAIEPATSRSATDKA